MWAVLFLTLPTRPNAVRLRVWRGLKALGCAPLRDGVYLLPRTRAALFDPLVAEVRAHDGDATVLDLAARDDAQRLAVQALFDRAAAYAEWRAQSQALAATLAGAPAHPALLAFGFGWAENMVQAAIRCVPLGQSAGQRILARLMAAMPGAVGRAAMLPQERWQAHTPGLAILSSVHETQYSRLFRS